MRKKHFVCAALPSLLFRLILVLALFVPALLNPSLAAAQNSALTQSSAHPVPIQFWNRVITYQRAAVGGVSPVDRAELAAQRLADLPLNASPDEISLKAIKVEDQEGNAFLFRGRFLFFLGANDLDPESSQTLAQATQSAIQNLTAALNARTAERTWPVIRRGALYTLLGFVALVLFCVLLWKAQAGILKFLRQREGLVSLRLFRVDLLPHISAAIYGLLRILTWVLTFFFIYAWVTISLRHFPYTEPWGDQAGGYVFNAFRHLGITVIDSLPGFFMVVVIFLVTRWLVRISNVFFSQVGSGRISLSWMDPDVAHATQRIVSAILWIFAIIVAYPYIPGSHTEAFKGLSVFFGLVISLGSTGIINQIMSGLFVVYSKALKTGEWVRVKETEGEVLEVGLLAAKVRTIDGQEVTIPNSLLVGTSTINYTRLGHPEGMVVSSTVSVGYDVPWRQVHALLELAASRTPNVRKTPQPYVLQRQLSDFYVEYTLITRLENEKLRIESVSNLNSAIQDAFNEFGVQIMSPHYMVQPEGSVTVPRSKWHAAPSASDAANSPQPEEKNSPDHRK